MEPRGGGVVEVRSKRKLNKTQRNVLLGVGIVAGLGFVGTLLKVLRREKPKRRKDGDVETLESVIERNSDNATPLHAQVQRTKLANLDNDEPDYEVVNRKRRSKYADSFSEIVSEDDIPNEGEIYVNQDPVGRRDGFKEPARDLGRRESNRSRDVSREAARDGFVARKGKQLSVSEGGGFNIKGVSNADANGKHHEKRDEHREKRDEHHEKRDEHHEERDEHHRASKEPMNDSSDASGSITQRKHRRGTSGESKQGRKKEVKEEKGEKRKTKHHPEVDADKEVIVDEAGRWESVNGYKVLRATTSKVPTYSEAVHKMDADSSNDLIREFERERAETEKAKSIWDGKLRPKKKHLTEGSEAYLQIKASVSSSVAGSEETPEGVKVREVVKRSTLLPIPSGDESEVHSSVYNVRETDQGLKVEEVLTRTKLLPAKGNFSLSDQQLLKKTYRKKPVRQDVLQFLPIVLRIVAVLVTLFSILLLLFSKKRIPFPFFY